MSKDPAKVVEIDIFDRRYPLRLNTPAEREEILKVAEEVDSRMRQIAKETRTVDSLKVAILTALHLAQEKHETAGGDRELASAVESASRKWIREIDHAL